MHVPWLCDYHINKKREKSAIHNVHATMVPQVGSSVLQLESWWFQLVPNKIWVNWYHPHNGPWRHPRLPVIGKACLHCRGSAFPWHHGHREEGPNHQGQRDDAPAHGQVLGQAIVLIRIFSSRQKMVSSEKKDARNPWKSWGVVDWCCVMLIDAAWCWLLVGDWSSS